MLSIGLWRWYINITITVLDIIHRPVFYLKHNFKETGFCLSLQMETTQQGPIYRDSLCVRTILYSLVTDILKVKSLRLS
jgi:hypothetical protein